MTFSATAEGLLIGKRYRLAGLVANLGAAWRLERAVFKQYPPPAVVTQGVTDRALRLAARHGRQAADLAQADVRLPPCAHRPVGHAFHIGANPRGDAQFNAGYCMAHALLRGRWRLAHFSPAMVATSPLCSAMRRGAPAHPVLHRWSARAPATNLGVTTPLEPP